MKPNNSEDRILTIKEVGAYLRIPLSTVYELVQKGKIPGVKVGRHWRFWESNIRHYLLAQIKDSGRTAGFSDKRKSPRMNVEGQCVFRVLLSPFLEKEYAGDVLNLSEDGFCVVTKPALAPAGHGGGETRTPVEEGDPVHVFLQIPEMTVSPLAARGRITRKSEDRGRIGIKFRSLSKEVKTMIREYVG